MAFRYLCVDFGSTFTKVVAVDADGTLVATGSARTTIDSDVMVGMDEAVADAGIALSADVDVLACSSAGGGLRIAVIGYERAITAEAGYRVGLSAGGRVCHVTSGELGAADVEVIREALPDVLLLVGGTDGGNADVLLHNARAIARADLALPVVVAGNGSARDQVVRILRRARISATVADNVLPKIGVLDPRSAREAIREVFISHVIGGKHLSTRVDLSTWIQAATPDAVLSGVELLADGTAGAAGVGDVVVVDVGGATTDVYSVTSPDLEDDPADREAVATMWRSRTVEGDLGVRWNAPGIVEAAQREGFIDAEAVAGLMDAAALRRSEPGYLPVTPNDRAVDRELARLAAAVALRRHARPHTVGAVRYPGKDLSRVSVVVGSGGVLRYSPKREALALIEAAVADPAGGWRTPERAGSLVDEQYVLAAAGLISRTNPASAMALLQRSLLNR
ncbi:MAG: glutamate mutase L [Actinomycetia bacterium]|nr:glutamate mutase L [Actinomycetes bacterium]